MNVANRMAIILKANKFNLFVSSVLFVLWYHLPNFLDTPHKSSNVTAILDRMWDCNWCLSIVTAADTTFDSPSIKPGIIDTFHLK
jgi:hypothetical protein